eukprot:CAMPEP_0175174334 /NCGR_PEP_ID=MMETSP0087-20121206/32574_1 /TAXON_ID=136419 /ORGANISM="Unknown Unknown, Strain D1" /LENGTH=44 /DNA_ID= /DNA_START= /DNA_END= /DNA_ORIENTATION=
MPERAPVHFALVHIVLRVEEVVGTALNVEVPGLVLPPRRPSLPF